ncbi:MAG: hypothetical protein ABIT58_07850, partial [Ferruginibacter sp.]
LLQFSLIKADSLPEDITKNTSQTNELLSPKQVIIQFLQWYKINMKKANSFPILIKDSANNFMINNAACAKYLNFLRSSNCLSRQYIQYWMSFFNDKATGLKSNPIQTDIPDGFDMDFVLITQEPELVLDHISEAKFKTLSLTKTTAVIGVSWPQKNDMIYNIQMHKYKDGWQIDHISSQNDD